ncbi:MAG: EAL domain-containing protein [Solirubrobacterales bacterium]
MSSWEKVRGLRLLLAAFLVGSIIYAACVLTGFACDLAENWVMPLMYLAMVVMTAATARRELRLNRRDRNAWALIFLGLGFWSIGIVLRGILYEGFDDRPVPAAVDIPFLLFYPAVFIGLQLLIRTRIRSYTKIPWIDGLTGALAMAAIAAAFIVNPIDNHSEGGLAATITLLAYPIGDLILIWLVATMFAIRGWQPNGPWLPLGLGLFLFAAADTVFAISGPSEDRILQLLAPVWLIGFLLINLAAWRNTDEEPEISPEPWRLFLPFVFSAMALTVIVAAQVMDVPVVAVFLAVAVLVTVGLRMLATIQESKRLAVTQIQAVTDDLTGLSNRRAAVALLEEITETDGEQTVHAGALLIDIDNFKALNDALGHTTGDLIISSIGKLIDRAVRDRGMTARLGGDEFTVIVSDGADELFLKTLATDITHALAVPLRLEGIDVHVDASIGGALLPSPATGATDLVSCADAAMRAAKGSGANYVLYEDQGTDNPRERLRLLEELRTGIERRELVVHFQPKMRLADQAVTGVEALVRWQHPEQGLIRPSGFLHLAERANLMRPIAREVLKQSIVAQSRWRDAGRDLNVAVNLAASNLFDQSLPAMIAGEFETHGCDPAQFTFEVNENVVMSGSEFSLEVLDQLRLLGCRISLDDFGAGTTALVHLRDLPIDEVKLDRTFIQRIVGKEKDRDIVEALVALAKKLGLTTVAEGVEDEDTLDFLSGIGCCSVQGLLIADTLRADEILPWVDRGPSVGNHSPRR